MNTVMKVAISLLEYVGYASPLTTDVNNGFQYRYSPGEIVTNDSIPLNVHAMIIKKK